MKDRLSPFKVAANVVGILVLGTTTAGASVSQNHHEAFGLGKGARSSETIEPTEYKFGELWDKYFPDSLHLEDTLVKGDLYDFDKYCTPFPRGCGINETDPDFDKQFHGHFYGYTVANKGGVWIYTENPDQP